MTRRSLITAAAGSTVAASAQAGKFEIGMHQATLWKCKSTIRQDYEAIAAAGFEQVELRQSKIDDQSEYSIAQVKSMLDDLGLSPLGSQLAPSLGFPDEKLPRRVEAFKRNLERTAALGIKLANCACVVREPNVTMDHYKRAVENYRIAAELAKPYGVVVAIEFMKFSTFLSTLSSALWMTREVNHPNLSIAADAFHIWTGRGKMTDLEKAAGREIFNFHINDVAAHKPRELLGDADRVMPGDGEIPLAAMLRTLRQKGYRGKLMVELFSPHWWRRPVDEVCRVAREKTGAVLARI